MIAMANQHFILWIELPTSDKYLRCDIDEGSPSMLCKTQGPDKPTY